MSVETVSYSPRAILDANPCLGEMRSGAKRFWTGREEKLLKEAYPKGGLPSCVSVLPGRSATSIYQRARTLGLKSPQHAPTPPQRYGQSDAVDAVIRRQFPACTAKGDVQRLAESVNRPSWWVSKRAAAMGLSAPRFRAPPWSPEELAMLREHHGLGLSALWRRLRRAGFSRTETAIGSQLKRMRLSRAEETDDYTSRGLAEVMGVDSHTVLRWINSGWLVAKEMPGGWRIKPRNVRTFIIENVAAVDIRKVEKHWLIDLLADRGGGI